MRDAERLGDLVGQLLDGWYDHVEYAVVVGGHTELRGAQRRHEGLLWQLQTAGQYLGSPGTGGGGHTKPKSRPPGNTAPLHTLDEITTHARFWHEALYEAAWCRLPEIMTWEAKMRDSVVLTKRLEDDSPPMVQRYVRDVNSWVKRSRIVLGYDKPEITLRDTVCGECSGTLVVATDASSDVRCVGTAEAAPCGVKYPRYQWVEMAREQTG